MIVDSEKKIFLEDHENGKWTTLKNIWFDVPGTLAFWSLLEHAPTTNLIQVLGVFWDGLTRAIISRLYWEDVQGLRVSRKFCDERYVTNFFCDAVYANMKLVSSLIYLTIDITIEFIFRRKIWTNSG